MTSPLWRPAEADRENRLRSCAVCPRRPTGSGISRCFLTESAGSAGDDGYTDALLDQLPTPRLPGRCYLRPNQVSKRSSFNRRQPGPLFHCHQPARRSSDLDNWLAPGMEPNRLRFPRLEWPRRRNQSGLPLLHPARVRRFPLFSLRLLQECADTQAPFPWLIDESDFRCLTLRCRMMVTGACLSHRRTPLYRLWNGRADSNHRYTTSTDGQDI